MSSTRVSPTAVAEATDQVRATLQRLGVVPVVKIDEAAKAGALGRALVDGGLPVAEVTFRTEAAAASIEVLVAEHPDLLVGAGTVLDVSTVDRAADAGAAFIVTPGFNPRVVQRCFEHDLPVVPGVSTATEVEAARALGLRLLKFFPAVPAGGLPMLRALAGPYPDVAFMPTGGIDPTNAAEWLAAPNVVAVGGTWVASPGDLAAGSFDAIEANARVAAGLRQPATT
jgi:2-dehydro-3-deoxyphosphogluconate aldolase/(4S)-4-hydroxy-2-oxoglutarate aldolase